VFSDRLLSELVDAISDAPPPLELSLSSSLSAAIEDRTRPIITSLAESSSRHAADASRLARRLCRLNKHVTALHSTFSTHTGSTLRALDRGRLDSISHRESENARAQAREAALRAAERKEIAFSAHLRGL
jgi:hypothetical protein